YLGSQPVVIIGMNHRRPTPAKLPVPRHAAARVKRATRIVQPTLAEVIDKAVGRYGPDQRGNVVDDASNLPLGLPGFLLGSLEICIQVRVLQRDRGLRGQHLEDRRSRRGEYVRGESVFQIEHATQRGPFLGAVTWLDDLQRQTEDRPAVLLTDVGIQ